MTQRTIEELSGDECFALLGQEVVGRLAFVDGDGPGAVPVNYGLAGRQIVFRVEPESHLRAVLEPRVAFEVDHLEPSTGSGWSVLVRGAGREVPIDDVPDLLRQMHGHIPGPWAEGVHNVWVCITPTLVTGRRLTAPYVGDIF
jgi:uncharacterized protein